MRYILLLRGINVGGKSLLKMAELKSMMDSLGYRNVQTYLQSGNVVFDFDSNETSVLERTIENQISENLHLDVKVLIRSSHEWEKMIADNPFIKMEGIDESKLHITLLQDVPPCGKISELELKKEEEEKYVVIHREVYLYCPNGYGNTKLNNSVFEKKLNIPATTRNWNTVRKLGEIAKK